MIQKINIWEINYREKYYTLFSQSYKLLCILTSKEKVTDEISDVLDTFWFEIVELKFNESANEFSPQNKQIFWDLPRIYERDFDLVDVYSKISLTDTGDVFFLPFQENLVIWLNEK